MKKASILFFLLFMGMSYKALAQAADTTATDFFAGKWEILVVGAPNGDIKFVTELTRKDGKLGGSLKDPSGAMPEPIPISNVEETKEQVTIFFSAQGYDVNILLNKVDQDNLKGSLMSMFDSTAKRIKEK